MATKNISLYSKLESTATQMVEDLYIIVDNSSIIVLVKNKKTSHVVAFEHFNDSANNGWNDLITYFQINSKLIEGNYGKIYFVLNTTKFILTNRLIKEDTLIYQDEINMIHEKSNDEELYITPFNDQLVLVFTVPDVLSTMLSRIFPTGKWHHYTEYILATEAEHEVQIYLFENKYFIKIVKEGTTQLINYFSIEAQDRNSYNILNACSNTNIKTNISKLKIWGYDSVKHTFINKLAPYFLSGEIIEIPNDGIGEQLNASQSQNIYSTYFIF